MKAFDYHKPNSVPEAVALLANGSESQPIAGGMTLLPTIKQRLAAPGALIDLSGIAALKGIDASAGAITIGAMTRHVDVATSQNVTKSVPALAQLAGSIGDPAVRNRGTIGGSLANNDPAADYPAAVLALGATIVTNTREIAADHFFRGMFETALDPGELITAVKFPLPARRRLRQGAECSLALRAGRRFRGKVRVGRAGRRDRRGTSCFSCSRAGDRTFRPFRADRRQRPWCRSGGIEFGHSRRGGVSGAPDHRHGQARCCGCARRRLMAEIRGAR